MRLALAGLSAAAGALRAQLEAALAAPGEWAAGLATSDARRAQLDALVASCVRELEAARAAGAAGEVAPGALEGRAGEARVREMELKFETLAREVRPTTVLLKGNNRH